MNDALFCHYCIPALSVYCTGLHSALHTQYVFRTDPFLRGGCVHARRYWRSRQRPDSLGSLCQIAELLFTSGAVMVSPCSYVWIFLFMYIYKCQGMTGPCPVLFFSMFCRGQWTLVGMGSVWFWYKLCICICMYCIRRRDRGGDLVSRP